MKRSVARLLYCSPLLVLTFASCGVDDRSLSFEYKALETAGTGSGGGSDSSGDSAAGQANDAGAPANGGASSGGAAPGDAGSAQMPEDGGSNPGGGADAGSSSTNGGATGGDASGGAPGGASGGTAGTPASTAGSANAGAPGVVFPCGDLNHDLVDDCAQTLVQNSRFDATIDNWSAESSLTATWSTTNGTGKAGSGSISLSHTGAGGTMIGARQCTPVVPYASYDVAARVQLAAGQTGKGGVNVYLYDDGACSGNIVTGNTPIEGGTAGAWVELAGSLWIPGNVHSMYVRLVADKPLNQATLNVLIDDVLVAKR